MSIQEWLQHTSPSRVSSCLPYARMTEVPASFDRFATLDFNALRGESPIARWSDYCPAYAFALLTHAAYSKQSSAGADFELDSLWDELRGGSTLAWPVASEIVRGAWRFLDSISVN